MAVGLVFAFVTALQIGWLLRYVAGTRSIFGYYRIIAGPILLCWRWRVAAEDADFFRSWNAVGVRSAGSRLG
jgi:hypothetical protein